MPDAFRYFIEAKSIRGRKPVKETGIQAGR
jgi:hypothetical protein